MSLVRGSLGVVVALLLTACGLGDGGSGDAGSEVTVTVKTGIDDAPADLAGASQPVARYVAGAHQVVFVSTALFSSSCPPHGSATQDGHQVVLTIDDGNDGNCLSDAIRDTFRIEHLQGTPTHLVVLQEGQPDQRLDLSGR
jgi:hypothetical protein